MRELGPAACWDREGYAGVHVVGWREEAQQQPQQHVVIVIVIVFGGL
jgi:hypothetical protein